MCAQAARRQICLPSPFVKPYRTLLGHFLKGRASRLFLRRQYKQYRARLTIEPTSNLVIRLRSRHDCRQLTVPEIHAHFESVASLPHFDTLRDRIVHPSVSSASATIVTKVKAMPRRFGCRLSRIFPSETVSQLLCRISYKLPTCFTRLVAPSPA